MSQIPSDPTPANPSSSSVQDTELVQRVDTEGDATGGVIPYKNPAALMAYYLGIFSFLPLIGLFLAVPAFVLGILGLRARKRNAAVKGSVHAWIGIVMGGLFSVIWGLAIASMVVAMLA